MNNERKKSLIFIVVVNLIFSLFSSVSKNEACKLIKVENTSNHFTIVEKKLNIDEISNNYLDSFLRIYSFHNFNYVICIQFFLFIIWYIGINSKYTSKICNKFKSLWITLRWQIKIIMYLIILWYMYIDYNIRIIMISFISARVLSQSDSNKVKFVAKKVALDNHNNMVKNIIRTSRSPDIRKESSYNSHKKSSHKGSPESWERVKDMNNITINNRKGTTPPTPAITKRLFNDDEITHSSRRYTTSTKKSSKIVQFAGVSTNQFTSPSPSSSPTMSSRSDTPTPVRSNFNTTHEADEDVASDTYNNNNNNSICDSNRKQVRNREGTPGIQKKINDNIPIQLSSRKEYNFDNNSNEEKNNTFNNINSNTNSNLLDNIKVGWSNIKSKFSSSGEKSNIQSQSPVVIQHETSSNIDNLKQNIGCSSFEMDIDNSPINNKDSEKVPIEYSMEDINNKRNLHEKVDEFVRKKKRNMKKISDEQEKDQNINAVVPFVNSTSPRPIIPVVESNNRSLSLIRRVKPREEIDTLTKYGKRKKISVPISIKNDVQYDGDNNIYKADNFIERRKKIQKNAQMEADNIIRKLVANSKEEPPKTKSDAANASSIPPIIKFNSTSVTSTATTTSTILDTPAINFGNADKSTTDKAITDKAIADKSSISNLSFSFNVTNNDAKTDPKDDIKTGKPPPSPTTNKKDVTIGIAFNGISSKDSSDVMPSFSLGTTVTSNPTKDTSAPATVNNTLSAPSISFGSSAPVSNAPAPVNNAPAFSFGSSLSNPTKDSPAPVNNAPAFSFGSSVSNPTKDTSAPAVVNNTLSAPSISFGSSASLSNAPTPVNNAPAFSFGSSLSNPTKDTSAPAAVNNTLSAPSISFGSSASLSNISASVSNKPAPIATPTTSFNFGSSSLNASSSNLTLNLTSTNSSDFGVSSTSVSNNPVSSQTFNFGSSSSNPTSSGAFGSSSGAPIAGAPAFSFGSSSSNAPTPTGSFGSSNLGGGATFNFGRK
jgi:hypothetical protein